MTDPRELVARVRPGRVGWVRLLGRGTARTAWRVKVDDDWLVVLDPHDADAAARLHREVETLHCLDSFALRVPRVVGVEGDGVVTTLVSGQAATDPTVAARVAARVHSLPLEAFPHLPRRPGGTVAVVGHGDLTARNVLEPDGLIDWEYAYVGDPAFDLAVIARPLDDPAPILAAYLDSGGRPEVRMADIVSWTRRWSASGE